jgi:predicted dehydrogenase
VQKKRKVGFAVVGLGLIAQGSVLPAFAHCRRSKLVALVSRDKQKAARLAHRYGAQAAYSLEEYTKCLANPEVDVVYIATPPGEHEAVTVQAATAEKHALCEKPLAATVEQSARMVAACREHGVLLMTAYRKYFEPSTRYLKKLIREGALGRVDVIHTAFNELQSPASPAWLLDPRLSGGGSLMDLGVYCVNTVRWLLDEDPTEVSAQWWRHDENKFRQVEEGIAFSMNFPSGTVAQASSSYGSVLSSFLSVQGTKGWALLAPAYPFDQERCLTGKVGGRSINRKFKVIDEFALELDAMSAALVNGESIEPDGLQGHRDVQIIQAIYQSAREQRSVVVRS